MYTLPYDATSSTIFFSRYLDTTKDIVISFDYACYGPKPEGSEGFCIYFTSSRRQSIQYGGPGPGLGYCPVSGIKAETDIGSFWGVDGGIIGVGFDLTGNFGSNKFFSSGVSGDDLNPNTITVRGLNLGGLSGAEFITQTNSLNTLNFDKPIRLYQHITDNQLPIFKRVRLRITDYGRRLVVDIKSPGDLSYTTYLNHDISGIVRWPTAVRCGLSFSTGQYTDTIFKIKGFNLNGGFTDTASMTDGGNENFDTYLYYTDTRSLSGEFIYSKAVFELNDIMKVVNAGTTSPIVSALAPIIAVNPVNGPEGAPYSQGDIYVRITSSQ